MPPIAKMLPFGLGRLANGTRTKRIITRIYTDLSNGTSAHRNFSTAPITWHGKWNADPSADRRIITRIYADLSNGTSALRHSGTLAHRHSGTSAHQHIGTLAHRHIGTSALWHIGTPAPRH